MIFQLKIFFVRPVPTPNGLVMFSTRTVEATAREAAIADLSEVWTQRGAVIDYVECGDETTTEGSGVARYLTKIFA